MPDILHKIDTSYYQSNASSCWYASYCMLFRWKGIPVSSIRERIEKKGLDYRDFWTKGLPDDKYADVRDALGLVSFPRLQFSRLAGNAEVLAAALQKFGPFWAALSAPSEHAVVIAGVIPAAGIVYVVNPWSVGENAAQQEAFTLGELQCRLGAKEHLAGVQMFMG